MTEKKELTRRLETGDTFMNHEHGNDLLYAYLYYLSTWDKNTQQLYLTHKNYLKERKVLMEILLCKSTRTVDNQLKKLLEQGILMKEGEIQINNKTERCYYFLQHPEEKYNIISRNLLHYLAHAFSTNSIRVYNFLFTGWKLYNNNFKFTITALQQAMSYSIVSKSTNQQLNDILMSLARGGIIEYYETRYINEDGISVPCKALTFLATNKNQLPILNLKKKPEEVAKIQKEKETNPFPSPDYITVPAKFCEYEQQLISQGLLKIENGKRYLRKYLCGAGYKLCDENTLAKGKWLEQSEEDYQQEKISYELAHQD